MSDRPTTCDGARELALDWAEGKRSWCNQFRGPGAPDNGEQTIAIVDAQEVVKWCAVATMLAQLEAIEFGVKP